MTICCICYEDRRLYKISDCGHKFCGECNQECVSNFETCPICRKKIKRNPSIFSSDIHLYKLSKFVGL